MDDRTEVELRAAKQTFCDMTLLGMEFAPMARLEGEKGHGMALLAVEGLGKWIALAELVKEVKANYVVMMADIWLATDDGSELLARYREDRHEAFAVTIFSSAGCDHHLFPYHREDGVVVWDEGPEECTLESEGAMLVMAALSE